MATYAKRESSVELVVEDEKESCLKPWMKVLIALALVVLLALALGVGVYFSLQMWTAAGEWTHLPCGKGSESCPPSYSKNPITVLISCDGFRASYLLKNVTPTFEKFQKCGVSAPYMRPVYPSKTFPNHYSMATGLFTESTGIIGNVMFDEKFDLVYRQNSSQRLNPAWWGGTPGLFPSFNGLIGNTMFDEDIGAVFKLSNAQKFNPEWYQGEPIWNTVTKHNKTSASYFWVGSDVPIEGMYPKYYKNYTYGIPFEDEVDAVLKWIDLPEERRPNFITMYFNQPDSDGHKYGPNSPEVRKQIEYVDSIIGMFMNGLVDRGIHNCINVIVVADHGMAETSCDRVVLVNDYIDTNKTYIFAGPFGRISTKYCIRGSTATMFKPPLRDQQKIVNSLKCANEHLQTQFKWDLPKRFHYAYNKRIEDIVMNVDEGWLIGRKNPKDVCRTIGQHGFDDAYKSMEAIFLANGPSFKSNYEVEPFVNVELYNLLTELMNITGVPNNGTVGSLHHLLRNPSTLPPREKGHAYETCSFPSGPEYNNRASAQPSCTECKLPKGVKKKDIDQQLDVKGPEAQKLIDQHIPSGPPLLHGQETVCTLTQKDYVDGYSEIYHSPIWSAYNLSQSFQVNITDGLPCLRPDVRLPVGVEANCSDFTSAFLADNITAGFLHPPEFSTDSKSKLDSHILSNAVPMFEGFKTGVWQHLLTKLTKWQAMYGAIYVISGPIYDYDYNGHYDDLKTIKRFMNDSFVPIPTHYYTIVTKPRSSMESSNRQNDVMAFILPHKSQPTTCQAPDVYLYLHSARVRDVELLTGLEFFPKLDRYEAIALETFLMDKLWAY